MKEFYEKYRKKIFLGCGILIAFIGLWITFISPLIKFKSNEKIFLEAGKRYYEVNSSELPTGEKISTVKLQRLYDKDYISSDLRTSYGSKLCNSENSWIKVRKENGTYKYYTYLKCGVFSSKGVDSEGPKITLKGNPIVEVNRGDKYKELGVSTVIDNTDGNIDVKKVIIDSSKVDTTQNGTYEVTYKALDSFKNETIITRKVIVNQNLTKMVKKKIDKNSKYYKASNNYIKVDGIIFRILKVNDDGSVKIVSSDALATVDYNSIDKWLNDYFYNKFSDNAKKYIIANSKWCSDTISDTKNYTKCNKYSKKQTVGLLSTDDINNYKNVTKEDINSYGKMWLINPSSSKQWSYDLSDSKFIENSKNELLNIYPVINIVKDTEIVAGEGTIEEPYRFKGNGISKPGTKVNELKTGEYIKYSGYTWRVIGKNDSNSTEVVLHEVFTKDYEEELHSNFSKYYNPTEKENLGYIISTDFTKNINTKKLSKEKIDVYQYTDKVSYISKDKIKSYNVKMSNVSMFDLFSTPTNLTEYYWYINSTNKKIYYSGYNGNALTKKTDEAMISSTKLKVNINSEVSIVRGEGTSNEPYTIS